MVTRMAFTSWESHGVPFYGQSPFSRAAGRTGHEAVELGLARSKAIVKNGEGAVGLIEPNAHRAIPPSGLCPERICPVCPNT